MKIEVPTIPGLEIPEFEISHRRNEPSLSYATGLSPRRSRRGLVIAVGLLLLLLVGGRRSTTT